MVAVVNDEVITQKELDQVLTPIYFQMQASLAPEEMAQEMDQVKRKVLERLIEAKVMLQEARNPRPVEVSKGKIGTPPVIEVSDTEVQQMLDETLGHLEDPNVLAENLKSQGMTLEELKTRLGDQITIQKLIDREVRSRVSVSPAEVTAYYEENRKQFMMPAAVQVATILIRPKDNLDVERSRAQAEDIQRMLSQGHDFYGLAKRFSDGLNAENGGRIGRLERGKNIREIDEVLFDLKPGDVSPIIRSPAGFHLFLIEEVQPARDAQIEEMQHQIREILREQKTQERYRQWIEKLKGDSYIAIK